MFKRLCFRIKQKFCKHELVLLYSSHYPFISCKKCGKYADSDFNSKLGKYIDKLKGKN